VILCVLPLAFDYGLYQMVMACRMGARLVIEQSFAYPAQVLASVVREGVTGFPGVPTIFAVLAELKEPSRIRLLQSSLRHEHGRGAAVKHIHGCARCFRTRGSIRCTASPKCKRCTYLPTEDIDRKPTSVGIAIPNTELWIVDEDGNNGWSEHRGQLVIRGATVMRGYWEKPEQTARKLKPGPLPGEYVLYTGDYCRLDDEG
jgi:acyl-CoA synthetase (AMP-forming)/AMP-acid ligase II